MSIRVLLADDHKMVREGLRSLFEKQPDIEIVGEAENGRMALNAEERERWCKHKVFPGFLAIVICFCTNVPLHSFRFTRYEIRGLKHENLI